MRISEPCYCGDTACPTCGSLQGTFHYNEEGQLKIQFTVNITEVRDGDGEPIGTDEEHYELAARTFIAQNQGTEHELLCDTGEAIYFEMEDIEVVKEEG